MSTLVSPLGGFGDIAVLTTQMCGNPREATIELNQLIRDLHTLEHHAKWKAEHPAEVKFDMAAGAPWCYATITLVRTNPRDW